MNFFAYLFLINAIFFNVSAERRKEVRPICAYDVLENVISEFGEISAKTGKLFGFAYLSPAQCGSSGLHS